MNVIVGGLGIAFIVFVVFMAMRGHQVRKEILNEVLPEMKSIYKKAQHRHERKKGRASTELKVAMEARVERLGDAEAS